MASPADLIRRLSTAPVASMAAVKLATCMGRVKVVCGVFLTRPNQLHRFAATGHGHAHGLGHIVHIQAATKTAAQQGDVQGDLVGVHPRLAAMARAMPGTWVGTQTSTAPSFTCAVQFMGSMVAWAR